MDADDGFEDARPDGEPSGEGGAPPAEAGEPEASPGLTVSSWSSLGSSTVDAPPPPPSDWRQVDPRPEGSAVTDDSHADDSPADDSAAADSPADDEHEEAKEVAGIATDDQMGVLSQAVARSIEMTAALSDRVEQVINDVGYVSSLVGTSGPATSAALPVDLLAMPGRVDGLGSTLTEIRLRLAALDALAERMDRMDELVTTMARLLSSDGQLSAGETVQSAVQGSMAELLAEQLVALDGRQGVIEEGLRAIWGRLDVVGGNLDALSGLLDSVHGSLDTVHGSLDTVHDHMELLSTTRPTGSMDSEASVGAIVAAIDAGIDKVSNTAATAAAGAAANAAAASAASAAAEQMAVVIDDLVGDPETGGGLHPTVVIDGDVLDEIVQTTVDSISIALGDRLGTATAEAAAELLADAVADAVAENVAAAQNEGMSTAEVLPGLLNAIAGTLDDFGERVDNDLDALGGGVEAVAGLMQRLIDAVGEMASGQEELAQAAVAAASGSGSAEEVTSVAEVAKARTSETFELLQRIAAETIDVARANHRRPAPRVVEEASAEVDGEDAGGPEAEEPLVPVKTRVRKRTRRAPAKVAAEPDATAAIPADETEPAATEDAGDADDPDDDGYLWGPGDQPGEPEDS